MMTTHTIKKLLQNKTAGVFLYPQRNNHPTYSVYINKIHNNPSFQILSQEPTETTKKYDKTPYALPTGKNIETTGIIH